VIRDPDIDWMRRAVRIASLSLGRTWPNPGVGCVLIRDGRLIGQGRHERCGEAHAEVLALRDAERRGESARGATAYVTLAPCTRHGRQPPCVDALVAAGVARVVAAIDDPNQDDARALLAKAGIAYEVGCGRALAEHVHGGFLTRIRLGRPRLTGKWAMTLDGSIAAVGGDAKWISTPEALALSRRRRRAFDAIVVGAGTAARDNPSLFAVPARGRGPVRVVLSASARLDDGNLVATAARTPTWLVHDANAEARAIAELAGRGIRAIAVADAHDPAAVAQALGREGLNDVLIEGGAAVHGGYLRAGLYDRLEVYVSAVTLGGGLPVATGAGVAAIADGARWEHECPPRLDGGTVALRLRSRR